jgi:cytochrome c5
MADADETAFRQMFPLVIGALAGLAVIFIVVAMVIDRGVDVYVPAGMTRAEAIAERIRPVGSVQFGGPETVAVAEEEEPDEPRTGDAVYGMACAACHDTGAAGSPLTQDTGIWEARLGERGYDGIWQNAWDGIGAMPARGGANITEEELHNAVQYMLEQAGISPDNEAW